MKVLHKATDKKSGFFPLPPAETEASESRSPDGLRVSEKEYWENYYGYAGSSDHSFEWNNGILEEKPMGDHLSYLIYDWFHSLLKQYLETYPVAKIFGTDMGFRLALPQKTVIRKPDLSIVLDSNPVRFGLLDRSYKGTFDMCIEFLSDSTKKEAERDTVEKKSEYAGTGVKEYFILDRLGNETFFFRLNRKGLYSRIRPAPGEIIRSAVLPGFQFRKADLYTRRGFESLAEDPVYNSFVLKKWQAERSRADEAEKKARKLADRLRSLGIDPETV